MKTVISNGRVKGTVVGVNPAMSVVSFSTGLSGLSGLSEAIALYHGDIHVYTS